MMMKLSAILTIAILFLSGSLLSAEAENGKVTIQLRQTHIECIPQDTLFARKVLDRLILLQTNLHRKIGIWPIQPLSVHIARDEVEYKTWIQGSTNPVIEFSQAFYSLSSRSVFLRSPRFLHNHRRIPMILLHEYVHLLIHRIFPDAPLWFHEGMAVYFSEGFEYQRVASLSMGMMLGEDTPLSEMKKGYPRNPLLSGTFYGKSALAVLTLMDFRGGSFMEFWEKGVRYRSFERAFWETWYITPDEYSVVFEEIAGSWFNKQLLIMSSSLIWAGLPLLLIVSWIVKRFRKHRLEREWEEEEINPQKQDESEDVEIRYIVDHRDNGDSSVR